MLRHSESERKRRPHVNERGNRAEQELILTGCVWRQHVQADPNGLAETWERGYGVSLLPLFDRQGCEGGRERMKQCERRCDWKPPRQVVPHKWLTPLGAYLKDTRWV